jgi:hypothetical protein
MSIGEESIHDYMNFIMKFAPEEDYATRNSVRYNLPDIDVEVVSKTTTGTLAIQTNIIVYHEIYTVRCKKTWTITKNADGSADTIPGPTTITVEGNEDTLAQHLVLLKLL